MQPSEYEVLAALEELHWWTTGMATIAQRLIHALRPLSGPILDAGCGTGGALLWLRRFGKAVGCDLSPHALAHACRKFDGPLLCADTQALPYRPAAFQLVTSFDVLYHQWVAGDERALRELWRVLRPGGWLCLRVPAFDRLRRSHDRRVYTRHRYGRAELRHKLQLARFEVVRLTYAGLLLLPLALVQSFIERIHPPASPDGADLRMPPAWLNRLLRASLEWEAPWAARGAVPFGLSLFALARKPADAVANKRP